MTRLRIRPLITSGIVIGIGMGGFVDGILFHQILQLHNMLSNQRFPDTLVNIEINMFWDGLFHAFTWLTTAVGIYLLWKAMKHTLVPRSDRTLVGSMILGWGMFNLVEGVIDHQIIQIHHVVQRASQPAQLYFDLLFLLIGGVLMIAVGWFNIRAAIRKLNVRERTLRFVA